jgi:YcaO-like protein with predicted kinase domain
MKAEQLQFFLDENAGLRDHDYIECSELITDRKFAIPKNGARLPNSCGLAAGNSLLEAILYGLYEVVEHDIYACYETNAIMKELRHLNLDPAVIRDQDFQTLISDLTARGHQVHFFNLVNCYDIPMVLCVLYESDRRLLFTGHGCRLDMQDAMYHSLHEALNGHYVSYFGSRDDRRGFEQQSVSAPLHFLEQFVAPPKCVPAKDRQAQSLARQLEVVLDRLQRQGIEHAFAIDLSPRDKYQLSVVKVVVPGMALRSGKRRSPEFYRKCIETLALVNRFTEGERPIDEIHWSPSVLRREFGRPLQRFFKA